MIVKVIRKDKTVFAVDAISYEIADNYVTIRTSSFCELTKTHISYAMELGDSYTPEHLYIMENGQTVDHIVFVKK